MAEDKHYPQLFIDEKYIQVYTFGMKTAIRKWGNSLGFRLPKGIAEQLELRDGSAIELEIVPGGVLLKPSKVRRSRYSVDELLKGVSRAKIHPLEEDTPVGHEVW